MSQPTRATSAATNDSYFSADVMLMGGISIIAFLGAWAFMDRAASVQTVAEFAVAASFVCNNPHFLASYTLLYGDYRRRILKDPAYFWAAIVVPLVLAGVIGTALIQLNAKLMAHIITAMYFLVGWHYVKQIFGCVIVTSVQRKIFYQYWQRRLILFNLFTTWFMSWIRSHVGGADWNFYGIPHYSLNLPMWQLYTVYVACGVSLAALIWIHVKMWIDDGIKPSPPAVAAFVSIYAWYLPAADHPGFNYLVPFFHSLQYLAFVWTLKKNQVQFQIRGLKDREWRRAWLRSFVGYAATATLLGTLSFEVIPGILDSLHWIPPRVLGTDPFLVAIILFINIHHYFIDNVIWRSDNETVRAFLFHAAPSRLEAVPISRAA